MSLRQTIQSLIALKQKELPFKVLPRELVLPLNSGKIITIPKSWLQPCVAGRWNMRSFPCHSRNSACSRRLMQTYILKAEKPN